MSKKHGGYKLDFNLRWEFVDIDREVKAGKISFMIKLPWKEADPSYYRTQNIVFKFHVGL